MKLELSSLRLPAASAEETLRALTAPEHRWVVGTTAAALLGLAVWYWGFAEPAGERVAALRGRQAAAQRELASLGDDTAVADLRGRVGAREAGVRATLERMSQDVQLVHVLRQLSSHADRYGVVVERIDVKTAEAPPAGGPARAAPPAGRSAADRGKDADKKGKARPPLQVRSQALELTLVCAWDAAARFLDELKTLPALMVVDRLEIERDAAAHPKLRLTLVLRLHSIRERVEEVLRT